MASKDIDKLTQKLAGTTVEGSEITVSFYKRQMKLDTEDSAEEILNELNKNPDVTVLNLEGNTMGIPAAKVIGKQLEKHPKLERLLAADMFTGRLKSEIPECLIALADGMTKAGVKLTELDLSDNAFGPNGMKGLVKFLSSESCYSLKVLKLHNNGLGPTGGKMLASALNNCYQASKATGKPLSITTFISGRGRLENEGSKALSKVFTEMKSLEHVEMPQNGINFEGISALAEAFSHNTNLRYLNLNDNTFTEVGAQAMAKYALPKLKNLEVLNFGDCLIRSGGGKAIASALREGKFEKLKTVHLSYDELDLAAGIAVISAILNKDLDHLDLDGNMFGEKGCDKLQEIMTKANKGDVLVPFDNDEDRSDGEDDCESEKVNDPNLQVTGTGLTPRSSYEVKDILLFPSPTKLKNAKAPEVFVKELGEKKNDINYAIKHLVNVCSIVDSTDESVTKNANICADEIFKSLFGDASSNEKNIEITSSILIHLGLLKVQA
ncbi:DgyrCDS6397 [Dimorphilus gyrociliatus]|uniref:DgyrCDS6397 n=1 Tax=Dimorphilus gyrociliatus TaxID=2664684 RepID=A0A7I8VQQ7_9ANNE|nr:DgyrCDS6397 [Dimorphilus gyrociliatus]